MDYFSFFTTLTLTGHKGQFDAIATGHRLWLRDGRGTQIVSTSREQQTYTQYVPLPSCRTVSVFRFFAAIVSALLYIHDEEFTRTHAHTHTHTHTHTHIRLTALFLGLPV